jgi:hypothetical protein
VIGELFMKDLRCPLLGVKRTWCGPNAMSAFGGKADINRQWLSQFMG